MKHVLLLLTVFSGVFANEKTDKQLNMPNDYKGRDLLVGRGAYFFFTDGTNREIWDDGTIDLEIENTYWFTNYYSTFQNINFIWKDGASSFGTPVSIDMATISIGVKEFFSIVPSLLNGYLGFGFTCGLVWTNNKSEFIPNHYFWASPGIVGKSGLILFAKSKVSIDIFFDAYYQPIWSGALNSYTDMGGFRTGVGMGYLF